jgi:hypothetical protein
MSRLPKKSRLLSLTLIAIIAVAAAGFGAASASSPVGNIALSGGDLRPSCDVSFEAIVKAANLTYDDVRQGAHAGKSLNQIIIDKGGDPAKLRADVVAACKRKLDPYVATGKLTQTQEDQYLARIAPILAEQMAKPLGPPPPPPSDLRSSPSARRSWTHS